FDAAGWVVSVGDGAVAQIGPAVLTGRAAKAAKAGTGGGYLGSVGETDRALDLVYDELGWTTDR
ncbi:NADH dehydrogenase FAD-containing subunit, partial [Natronoarchaeum mannanilyticum]